MNMSEHNITIFYELDESKGAYLVGTDLGPIFSYCINKMESYILLELIMKELTKVLNAVDKLKFPKRGILFHIPKHSEVYKRYLNNYTIIFI